MRPPCSPRCRCAPTSARCATTFTSPAAPKACAAPGLRNRHVLRGATALRPLSGLRALGGNDRRWVENCRSACSQDGRINYAKISIATSASRLRHAVAEGVIIRANARASINDGAILKKDSVGFAKKKSGI